MANKDLNALAHAIYEGNYEEKPKTVSNKTPKGNESDYHNDSIRGKAALSGEDAACKFLQDKGFEIVKRNYRCYVGEIDIIASHNGTLHFVEVKTRSSELYGLPREAVTWTKQKKIRRSAESYLAMTKLINNMPPLSFDVIEVIRTAGQIKSVNHLIGCF